MKIVVDYDLCQGHAVCMGEAPEVFQVDSKGMLTVLQESPPEELREKVEAAAEYCPTGSIKIID
jgi:sterol 14alpha-demethylase